MSTSPNSATNTHASAIDWPRFVEYVKSHKHFLLTTHIRCDCDALGSTLAMESILQQLGKQTQIVLGYDLPPSFRRLDRRNRVRRLDEFSSQELDEFDAIVVLDTSAWAQLGHVEELLRNTSADKIIVDHHQSGDDLGAVVYKDSSAEATGRIVVEAADRLGVEITPEMAEQLFAALVTDTGWLHYSSTTSDSYRLAARLIDAGAVPERIYKELYEQESLARLKLIGLTLANVETELEGRLIYTLITLDDFREAGALPTDSEDVINMTLSVAGTQVALIFVEQADGGVKVSFRSRCDVNCAELAEQFGGGGHKAAAGALIHEPMDTARARVLDATRAAMR